MDLDSDIFYKVYIPPNFQKSLKNILKKDVYYKLECSLHGLKKSTKFGGLMLYKDACINARSRNTGYFNIVDKNKNIVGNMYIENTPYSKHINYTCLKVS